MSEILDNIVNCSISVEAPVEDGTSFSTILVIGKKPLVNGSHFKDFDRYASLPEVVDAGWEENTEVYKAAQAAFRQEPGPRLIYIAVRRKNGEGETQEVPDNDSSSGQGAGDILEDITETVKRVLGMPGWYGLALVDAEEEEYDRVAGLVENVEKIFAFCTKKKKNPLGGKGYMRTFGVYSEDGYVHIAWMAKNFTFAPGSATWAYKLLSGVEPSGLSSREMRLLEDEGLNYYVACAGSNITRNGKVVGGEWIDVVRFRDWLKNQMQVRIYELFVKNPKIPYTDAGITLVENQMEAVLVSGQKAGGIADMEYDEDNNPIPGYKVTVPRAASIRSAQRKKRILTGCRFTARLSGAIHMVELSGNLTF